jgi:hypothetical protein
VAPRASGGSCVGRDLALVAKYKTDNKIGIGIINHCNTIVEPASSTSPI